MEGREGSKDRTTGRKKDEGAERSTQEETQAEEMREETEGGQRNDMQVK